MFYRLFDPTDLTRSAKLLRALLAAAFLSLPIGCHMIVPDVSHQPVIHNPFPQLSRVAVAPFFNQSDEATLDGRRFAMAYYSELQTVPGFEVVPLGVVEEAMIKHAIDLGSPGEARRLATVLGIDAVIVGTVTDYSPYYPPRCGMRVEWYAANPGYHEIPAGYGLPWGTAEEEFIPAPLVFEAEMALARAQLATQSPNCEAGCVELPAHPLQDLSLQNLTQPLLLQPTPLVAPPTEPEGQDESEALPAPPDEAESGEVAASFEKPSERADQEGDSTLVFSPASSPGPPLLSEQSVVSATTGPIVADNFLPPGVPADWPDERGFIPPGPRLERPECVVNHGPVMTHTRIYHGNDSELTEALESYVHFRDDARFGGWQNFLQRSDDFIRFCCHMHISELLSARGGAGETRVVWSWSENR